jgi:outer membrane protein assembly factor BamB
LLAALPGRLYAIVTTGRRSQFTVVRETGGTVMRRRVAFGLSSFLTNVSAGPDGLYAGTAVIRRFRDVPDELLRIDPRTLRVVARASFGASVRTVEQGRSMWAATGDGRVARLDPRTLKILGSQQVLSTAAVEAGGTLSAPAVGAGSLWVLAGDAPKLELVRIDPATLAIRSRTALAAQGVPAGAVHAVVAGGGSVYLVGSKIAAVRADGTLAWTSGAVPGLDAGEVVGSKLVGLVSRPSALVGLDGRGHVVRRTALRDASAQLAVSGRDAWLVGDGGRGEGIVHVRLAR